MYKCDDCGAIFECDEAVEVYEPREFWGAACDEVWNGCPECGSTDLREYYEPDEEEEDEEESDGEL